mmetsp:Transcript_15716/g.36196  ORF Transcript_15716/g.36196 Transcript_15716/m.36196 type:complete len:88 (-) Transcript_15716:356-619(-)
MGEFCKLSSDTVVPGLAGTAPEIKFDLSPCEHLSDVSASAGEEFWAFRPNEEFKLELKGFDCRPFLRLPPALVILLLLAEKLFDKPS